MYLTQLVALLVTFLDHCGIILGEKSLISMKQMTKFIYQ